MRWEPRADIRRFARRRQRYGTAAGARFQRVVPPRRGAFSRCATAC